ncbi:hypothetical protein DID73_01400 [Candidatus Marinamargulisbacteria bacterium SCGC AG-343-K17]|nr:hypothetical protein DID73_01400 [Candidatus Marinamargulisbacteria bacterium SCGC AG-343-K17]
MTNNSKDINHLYTIYDRYCETHPDDDKAHFILGTILFLLNKVEDAIRTFEKCMRINPTFNSLNFNLGLCNITLEKFIESEKYFRIELENTNYKHLNSALSLANLYLNKMSLFDIEAMVEIEDIIKQSMIHFNENETLKRDFDLIKYINRRNKKWGKFKIFNSREEILTYLSVGGIAAEIGVQEGNFSEKILTRQPKHLHLIDCWDFQPSEKYIDHHANISQQYHDQLFEEVIKKFEKEINNQQVIIHKDYSANVFKTFSPNTFDWVYIDANHAYEFVKEDLNLAYLKTKPGGFICGHDYVSEEFIKGYGVERAVDEFIEEKNMIPIGLTNEFYSSFILQKPKGEL